MANEEVPTNAANGSIEKAPKSPKAEKPKSQKPFREGDKSPLRDTESPNGADKPRRHRRRSRRSSYVPYEVLLKRHEEEQKTKQVLETKVKGTVKWFSMRYHYGFLSRDDEKPDVFVHQMNIIKSRMNKVYWRSLAPNEKVEFDVVEGKAGLEAANVTGPNGSNVLGMYVVRVPYANGRRFNRKPGQRRRTESRASASANESSPEKDRKPKRRSNFRRNRRSTGKSESGENKKIEKTLDSKVDQIVEGVGSVKNGPSKSLVDVVELTTVNAPSDRFKGLIDRALEEIRKEPEELAEAHKIFETLKAKYEADRAFESHFAETPFSSKTSKKISKQAYREQISPYSTGASTPARSGPNSVVSIESSSQIVEVTSNVCPLCEMKMCNKYAVRKHIQKIHHQEATMASTKDLPFKCNQCSMSFTSKAGLLAHEKRHTTDDAYECPQCHKRYKFVNEFRKHMIRVHKYQPDTLKDLTKFEIGNQDEDGSDCDDLLAKELADLNDHDDADNDEALLLQALSD
ncbi:hypothetical protein FO519_001524 [Halicephalobus sp. NKZ332]|nr:hypothetical protein FO519_001524 [Halicephalobus sp. NKZ332]